MAIELCPCGCGHSLTWVRMFGHDEPEQVRPAEAQQTEFVIQLSLFPELVPDKFELVLPF